MLTVKLIGITAVAYSLSVLVFYLAMTRLADGLADL